MPDGKVLVNDRIADNMFRQVLTHPSEFSVLETTNLNRDYLANPSALFLSGAMMLNHLGLDASAGALVRAVEKTLADCIMTHDVARTRSGSREVGTKRFAEEVILRL